jgi:hypothetical protein
MRGKNALRACGLAVVLLAMAATTDPAFGVSVFAQGSVQTADGLTNPWDESKNGSGSPELHLNSTHGPNQAFVGAFGSPGVWGVGASATVAASLEGRGPIAVSSIFLTVTDRVTPILPAGINADLIAYTQHFDIQGTTSGSAVSPGYFDAAASVRVTQGSTGLVDISETLTSDMGYVETMPRGDLSWTVGVTPNVPFNLRMDLGASALAFAIEDAGSANADADFSHTFRWGEVTDVFDVTTGQPIPASDFHLYGEDGFDWAHPLAVPEPATRVLAIVGFVGLAAFAPRRRRR